MVKVLFMDGFDLHIPSTGNMNRLPGFYDISSYWYKPPLHTGGPFIEGVYGGQAYAGLHYLDGAGQSTAIPSEIYGFNSIPRNERHLRLCFWVRVNSDVLTGTTFAPWISFKTFGIGVMMNNLKEVRAYLDPGIRAVGAIGALGQKIPISDSAYSFVTSFEWSFCEVELDLDGGWFRFFHNDTMILQVNLQTLAPQWQQWLGPGTTYQDFIEALEGPDLTICRPDIAINTYIDHVIVTDGLRPEPGRVHCLAPTAAWSTLEGVGQLRGNMVIHDASYPTVPIGTSGTAGWIVPDPDRPFEIAPIRNVGPVKYYPYPVNPRTRQPWTLSDLDTITGWGVCGARMFDPDEAGAGDLSQGSSIVLWALGLSVVETMTDPRGYPIIRLEPPTGLTYYSGFWLKSHPKAAVTAHLWDHPRTVGEPGVENANRYLATNVNGCLLFRYQPGPVRPFDSIGLTFAEEKRDDYKDWYDATGHDWPFSSYFITGYNVLGEGNKVFQSNYVTVNYVPVPQGSAYIQGVWDYAKNGNTGRWSSKQQIYSNSDTNYSNRMRKLKIRGQGVAMQMKVSSEDGKPFSINGWSTSASSNAGV